ncbi:MAG: hypothetical protein R3C55_02320 [Parvularculaceae bacterium]
MTSGESSVLVALRVKASPARAFDVFTQEIGVWWRPDPLFEITPRGDGRLKFEGGEGGRLITGAAERKSLRSGTRHRVGAGAVPRL